MSLLGEGVQGLLAESREREKTQTLFYRALAAKAQTAGDLAGAEDLNELHADEQHHLSRLTARLLELGGSPSDLRDRAVPAAPYPRWKDTARDRELEEVSWYLEVLESPLDPETRRVIEEILSSERMHILELAGKWMPA